jgi:hypothetical protein
MAAKHDPKLEEEEPSEAEAGASLLELVIEASTTPEESVARRRKDPFVVPDRIHGIVRGRLLAMAGAPLVAWAGAEDGIVARAACVLGADAVGSEVALAFEAGDPTKPLVMGVMAPFDPPAPHAPVASALSADGLRVEVKGDKQRLVLESERELVLRCGKASITLTRAGKIIVRGEHVATVATGMNRILGGAVEIN